MPEQIVQIEFQADYKQLDQAVDRLVAIGAIDAKVAQDFKKTSIEIDKQAAALKKQATAGQQSAKSIEKIEKEMRDVSRIAQEGFLEGMNDALKEAGVSVDEFLLGLKNLGKETKNTNTSQTSLKAELKSLKAQMADVAINGAGMLSQEYKELKARAGELDDTLKDVSNDIANAGSDTRNMDNLVGTVNAATGAFSALQGAQALFGEESEDLQKALLKVNAAMALSTGIQQVSNALTKQGAITRLFDATATGVQVAAQKILAATTMKTVAATIALRAALIATGIGAVVVLVLALADAFKKTNNELEQSTKLIDFETAALERMNTVIEQTTALEEARARAAGAQESQLIRIRGRALQQQFRQLEVTNILLATQRDSLDATSEAWFKLNEQVEKNNQALGALANQITIASIDLVKQEADEKAEALKKGAEKAKKFNEDRLQKEREARERDFADYKAKQELKVLAAKKGSDEELAARKDLMRAQLMIDLEAEGLTQNQKKLLIKKFFAERLELEKQFADKREEIILQNIGSDLQAELQNLNLSNAKKLELTEAAINIAAELEINAAEGNASKIAEINAKRDAQIRDARIASIREVAEFEIAMANAQGGPARRALEKVANDEKQRKDIRLNAIDQIEALELSTIDRRIKANRDALTVEGADRKALELEYEQLLDQRNQTEEAAADKRVQINEKATAEIVKQNIQIINAVIDGLGQLTQIISGIQQNQNQFAEQQIESQKNRIDELVKAGVISEKEAEKRRKKVEEEERKVKNRAARQAKSLAVFNALLQVPQAFIAGLTAPFPIGGPIYGAILAGLAATQAAVIASRPVPQFGSGKRKTNRYSGEAIVGELGTELVEKEDGTMWLVTKRTKTVINAEDRVYSPAETREIMQPKVDKRVFVNEGEKSTISIDYNKMAEAIARNQNGGTTINIDKEFISESVANGLTKTQYFDRYYRSK